jgi:hypothetical protein
MPGFMPGIHVLTIFQDVDGRDKPGHDVERYRAASRLILSTRATWAASRLLPSNI